MKKTKLTKSKKTNVKTLKSETKKIEQKQNRVYGIIGMVILFFIGVIFGYIINGSDHVNHSIMSQAECENLVVHIKHLIQTNDFDQLRLANEMYSENCLDRDFEHPKPQPKVEEKKSPDTTCVKIEKILSNRLFRADSPDANDHIDNAKIYANLSERGCPENSEMYKELAAGELEIARALNDDDLQDEYKSIEIVETYKRLKMQAEAERMIEKAKRLTNPAIDFIIQLEKIIEE